MEGTEKKIFAGIIGRSQRVKQLQRGEGNFLNDGNVLIRNRSGSTNLYIC